MDAERGTVELRRQTVEPWTHRLHLSLNYLPALVAGLFLWLFSLVWLGWTNGFVLLSSTCVLTLTMAEGLGRRPYLIQLGTHLEVRNIARVHSVRISSIEGVCLHNLRLGKDTCPGLRIANRRRTVPMLAYFGFTTHDAAEALHLGRA